MPVVRLADYIVSYSLQINNRCLRFLADSHAKGMGFTHDGGLADSDELLLEAQPVLVESMLVRDSRRLLSMWSWMGTAQESVATHHNLLARTVNDLTESVAPTRLALRLASQAAGEEDATRLLMLARALKPPPGVHWTELSELFTTDSELWREDQRSAEIDNETLIEKVFFNYRKGVKIERRLPSDLNSVDPKETSRVFKLLRRQKNFSQASLHQLELLRPGLSEKGKRQLWYLDKLADAHRILSGLNQLYGLIDQAELRKSEAKATKSYVTGQVEKIHKRIERLCPRAYDLRPKRFRQSLQQCLVRLELDSVHALTRRTNENQVTKDDERETNNG